MSDNEFLITTRRRRANAGSRLKHLIDLEGQAEETQQSISQIYTEDDENVNLLFQEDENDVEFIEEDSEEEEDNNESYENDDEDNDEDNDIINKKRKLIENDEDEEVPSINSDEQLSDSEISASDTDMSEGENELQREEKLKKRKLKKKQNLIPIIKSAEVKTPIKKKPKNFKASEALLVESRRSSSRSSVLENKQALVKKLKESERRRAHSTPIVRIQHQDLTQEEKLAEAVETEKANILSLNEFMEQEIIKKEKQRQLLWSKRVKLTDVIRTVTKETFISPLDEVLESRYLQQLLKKAKKRPGRKKKIADKAEYYRLPGELDMELPSVKEEMIRKKELEENISENDQMKEEPISEIEIREPESNSELDTETKTENNTLTNLEINTNTTDYVDNNNEENTNNKEDNIEKYTEQRDVLIDSNTKLELSLESKVDETNEEPGQKIKLVNLKNSNPSCNNESGHKENSDKEDSNKEDSKMENNDIMTDDNLTTKNDEPESKTEIDEKPIARETNELIKDENLNNANKENESDNEDKQIEMKEQEKRVKFADDLEEDNSKESEGPDSDFPTPVPEVQRDETFEGPSQKVARNSVYLIDFSANTELNDQNIKKILFGDQSLLPASRRFKDLKTVIRIRKVEDPYAVVKYETDSLFSSALELNEESSIFEELRRIPKFGEIEEDIEEIENNSTEETTAIILKTEAPTGLYLPNGNKKNCLISGTEVKYFDPNNGIPYSSVETYRFLKSIEQGNVPWYSISESLNDTGSAEFYLGTRDGSFRHAKGVPDDFDI